MANDDDFLNLPRWYYIGGEDSMIHGPFPSVEMLNWLGGSFFQPNLMLRLLNDTEFYPLGQLFNACGNENPFSFPGTKFEEIVTNYQLSLSVQVQQQRVQSVPASGGYSSLPATPSSTPTPGPGFGINGVEPQQQQFQQSHHQQQQPVPGPPLVPFQVQMIRPPLHPSQFLLMPPPPVGPNTPQMAPAAMFRPGPHQPMFSPPNQQQQAPPIPVPTSFLTSHAVAFHHHQQQQQFLHQQQSHQQQQQNGGGPLLPTFPPPPPFSMPETRFPPPTFLQLQHNNLHHQNGGGGAEHRVKREMEESGGQQNLGKEKEETGTAILGMGVGGGGAMGMEASDSPDSGHVVTPCAQPDKSVDTDDAPWNQRPWPLVDKAVGPDASEANNVGAQTETHTISPLDAQKWISQLLGFPVLIIEEKKAGKTTKEK